MSLLSFTLATLLIVMTLMPLSIRREWWIRAMDFPSLQIAVVSALWLGFWLNSSTNMGWFSTLMALAVFAVLIHQCRLIFPYTEMYKQEVDNYLYDIDGNRPTIKLLSSNVLMSNRHSDTLLHMIRQHQPDVFIALESDEWWQQQLDTVEGYPHSVKCPLDNLYGMHIYSKLPLHDSKIHFSVEADKPSIQTIVEVGSTQFVNLHCLHPAPPAPLENAESTERDVELLMLAQQLEDNTQPTIVTALRQQHLLNLPRGELNLVLLVPSAAPSLSLMSRALLLAEKKFRVLTGKNFRNLTRTQQPPRKGRTTGGLQRASRSRGQHHRKGGRSRRRRRKRLQSQSPARAPQQRMRDRSRKRKRNGLMTEREKRATNSSQ